MANEDTLKSVEAATEEAALLGQAKREERGHLVSERKEVASGGGTFNLQLKNPSGSGRNLNVLSVTITTAFEGTATIYDDFSTNPSGGTEALIDNLLMDTDKVNGGGIAVTNFDVSFTANEPHVKGVIPSGGAEKETIGGQFSPTSPLIEPGREIVAEAVNNSASNRSAAITIPYVEEARDE